MYTLLAFLLLLSVITADNISQLQSVHTVDFDSASQIGQINSGWFALSPDGTHVAVPHMNGGLVIWNTQGELVDSTVTPTENGEPATLLDADFSLDGSQIAAVYTDGEDYYLTIHTLEGDTRIIDYMPGAGRPVRVWMDDDGSSVWLETAPELNSIYQGYLVVRVPFDNKESTAFYPSAPEHDTEAFVRIGRIPAPYAVTSTPEGLVRLWDLQSGRVLNEVQLDVAPVFGRVNEVTGQYMAWRDPASQTLQLLDFETGESTLLAELDGAYIQALMVTPNADVVLAVHIGDDPVVAAWDVATGMRYDLGNYRECSRVPDLVQLSRDGSTLVIGCATGLDIWQIKE